MDKNRKLIISISGCNTFLNIFYSLFFNIYILQNVTSNVVHLLLYYLIGVVISILLYYPFFKILNSKTSAWIYRMSYVISFITIILSMVVNSKIAFGLIFINALRYVYNMCYYIPSEIATVQNTENGNVNKFLAIKYTTNVTVNVVFSLLISYMVQNINIYILFGIMLVDVVIMFILSFQITSFGANDDFKPNEFFNNFRKIPYMKQIYTCHFYKKMGDAGVVKTLIPIMIFNKFGSEFTLGIISSIASVLVIISVLLFTKFYERRHHILLVSDILSILFSIFLISFTNSIFYIIYYLINEIDNTIYSNAQISTLFSAIKNEELQGYKKEHAYFYTFFAAIAEVLSYVIGILLVSIIPMEYSIPTIVLLFMIIKFVSILLLIRSDKTIAALKTENEKIEETK